MQVRIVPLFITLTATLVLPAVADAAQAGNPAAEALANKFAGASDEARQKKEAEQKAKREAEAAATAAKAVEERKAEEADMLARARAEAEERDAAATRDEDAKRLEAQRAEAQRLEAERKVAEAKAAAEKVEQAKAEAAKAAEAKALEEQRRADEERRAAAEAEKAKAAARDAEEAALEAARQREAEALSEKLKRVREERPAPKSVFEQAEPGMPSAPAISFDDRPLERRLTEMPAAPASTIATGAVTVVLAMDPGTYGIRRGNKTADPVLCVDTGCYVSAGAATDAKWMAKGLALGPINTLGTRAGACRGSLVCVFRNVDLSATGRLQPVDLHYLRHDRREVMAVKADPDCTAGSDHLVCSRVIEAKGWRAWIVPEAVAEKAGAAALQKAAASLANPMQSAENTGPVAR